MGLGTFLLGVQAGLPNRPSRGGGVAQTPITSDASSMSGTYFTPEQQAMGQKLFDAQMGMMDKFTGYLDNWQPMGGMGGVGGGGGGDFASYFNNVAGGMPSANFTDVPVEDVFTPRMLNEQVNNLFANAQSGAGKGALGLFSARPGMSPVAGNVDHSAALLDAATRAGIAREYSRAVPNLAFRNQEQKLQARAMQTNVENSRLNAMLQQGALASGVRGQDIQGQLGMGRLAVDDRGNFLRALGGFGGGFGGFGGLLQPLQYSESSSHSGPSRGVFNTFFGGQGAGLG